MSHSISKIDSNWILLSFFPFRSHLGTTFIIGEEIPRKTVSQHCRTCRILVIAASHRNPSKNLVSESSCQSKAAARSRNRKDSHGPNGTNVWNGNLHEYGLFSARRSHGQCNAFSIEINDADCSANKRHKRYQSQHQLNIRVSAWDDGRGTYASFKQPLRAECVLFAETPYRRYSYQFLWWFAADSSTRHWIAAVATAAESGRHQFCTKWREKN